MIQINNRFLILIEIMGFNNVISMDVPRDEVVAAGEGGVIIPDNNHYEEDDLLDPDRTKMTELRKVIEANKKKIIGYSLFSSVFCGGLFNKFFIEGISEESSYFRFIKNNPIKSTTIVAAGGGIIAGGSTVLHYVGEREKKREQLNCIKGYEKEIEDIKNDLLFDDITKTIKIDTLEIVRNKAIQKYKGS